MYNKITELRENSDKAKKFFLKKIAFTLGPIELLNLMQNQDITLIDVRKNADFAINHIPSAISVPKNEITEHFEKLCKNKITVVYSYNQQCQDAAYCCLTLADYGYPVMMLEGGFRTWLEDFKMDVESSKD